MHIHMHTYQNIEWITEVITQMQSTDFFKERTQDYKSVAHFMMGSYGNTSHRLGTENITI